MCKKENDGQRERCPELAAPLQGEILRILRSLPPEKRLRALKLLRQLEEGARE